MMFFINKDKIKEEYSRLYRKNEKFLKDLEMRYKIIWLPAEAFDELKTIVQADTNYIITNNFRFMRLKEGENFSYAKGYKDALDMSDNCTINILGYDVSEILDVMEKHKMKKAVMTRSEAIVSLQKHCPVDDPAAIIDFYIEAGMLEIKEEDNKDLYKETTPENGTISLTKYRNIYVLWYHGQIVWSSK